MEFLEGDYDILTSYFLKKFVELPPTGLYVISKFEYRPDLASFYIYGTVDLQFLVMLYNGIQDASEMYIGLRLKYPSLASIENLYFDLKSKETSYQFSG
jgi:hypothetical protein